MQSVPWKAVPVSSGEVTPVTLPSWFGYNIF